jgi:hypothetical protein
MGLGSFSKDKLVFDPTATLDSDNVGAYVRSSDGSLITDHEIAESETAGLISQGLILTSKLPGAVGNTYSFQVVDTTPGAISFTEVAGAIIVDLHNNTPTKAAVAALLAASTYANVSVGTPATGNVIVAASQPFVNGADASFHNHLDVYSATADGFGNPITSTAGALDVNLKSPVVVNVDLNGIYNGSTNPLPDNVGLIGSSRSAPGLANQTLQFTGGSVASDNVATTNIVAQDVNAFGMMWDSAGSNWDRLQGNTTDGLFVKITNSLTVSGDIADDDVDGSSKPMKAGSRSRWGALVALSNDGDRADVISDKYRRVYVNNGANIGIANKSVSIDNTAEVELKAGASRLEGRRLIMVQNLSNKEIYIGKATFANSTDGLVLAARATIELDIGQDVALLAKGSVATAQDIRVFEMA